MASSVHFSDHFELKICASKLEMIENGDIAHVLDFEVGLDGPMLVVWFNILDEHGMDFILDFDLFITKQSGEFIDVFGVQGDGSHSPGYPTSWTIPYDDQDTFDHADLKVGLYLSIEEIGMPSSRSSG